MQIFYKQAVVSCQNLIPVYTIINEMLLTARVERSSIFRPAL